MYGANLGFHGTHHRGTAHTDSGQRWAGMCRRCTDTDRRTVGDVRLFVDRPERIHIE